MVRFVSHGPVHCSFCGKSDQESRRRRRRRVHLQRMRELSRKVPKDGAVPAIRGALISPPNPRVRGHSERPVVIGRYYDVDFGRRVEEVDGLGETMGKPSSDMMSSNVTRHALCRH